MSGIFDYDGFLMQFFSKIFDLLLLDLLWIVGCLPIVTVGASTTAMCAVMVKLVRGESYGVLRDFWQSFKSNFGQATAIWGIFVGMFVILGTDVFFCLWVVKNAELKGILLGVFVLLAIIVAGMLLYVFPLQACFYNKVKTTVKNSVMFSLANLWKTLLMLVADVAIICLTVFAVQQMFLFAGILAALINIALMKKIFAPYLDPERPV